MLKNTNLNSSCEEAEAAADRQCGLSRAPSLLSPELCQHLQQEILGYFSRPGAAEKNAPSQLEAYVTIQWNRRVRRHGVAAATTSLSHPLLKQLILLLTATFESVQQAKDDDDPNWPDNLYFWVIDQLIVQEKSV